MMRLILLIKTDDKTGAVMFALSPDEMGDDPHEWGFAKILSDAITSAVMGMGDGAFAISGEGVEAVVDNFLKDNTAA